MVSTQEKMMMQKEREVEFAEFETRVRKFILELMEPTIHKNSVIENAVSNLQAASQKHAAALTEMTALSVKSEQHVSMVEHFREEMAKWDVERRTKEATVAEEIALVKQELDAFRFNLERKESAMHGLTRNVDRVAGEMNRFQEGSENLRKYCERRLDKQSGVINSAKTELEVKLLAVETKHNELSDELWGEETGLSSVISGLNKTDKIVAGLSEELKRVTKGKAEVSQLTKLQEEVSEMLREANGDVSTLKRMVGNVVNDVQEHFRTAANTIAAHNATMISEVRSSYQEELNHSAKLRSEVVTFMQETQRSVTHLEELVNAAQGQAEAMITEVRNEMEELNKKRKRDRSNADLENKALKHRLAGVFENSDQVLKGLEHLSNVLAVILESERQAAALEIQDDIDRTKVALMGYKEEKKNAGGGPGGLGISGRNGSLGGGNSQQLGGGGAGASGGGSGAVMSVDNRCLSCSGQGATVLSGFKIACLNYAPGPVQYQKRVFERADLLGVRQQLLEQAFEALQNGPGTRPSQAGSLEVYEKAHNMRGAPGDKPQLGKGATGGRTLKEPEEKEDMEGDPNQAGTRAASAASWGSQNEPEPSPTPGLDGQRSVTPGSGRGSVESGTRARSATPGAGSRGIGSQKLRPLAPRAPSSVR